MLYDFEPVFADFEASDAFGTQKAGSIVLKNYYYICSCKIADQSPISHHFYNSHSIHHSPATPFVFPLFLFSFPYFQPNQQIGHCTILTSSPPAPPPSPLVYPIGRSLEPAGSMNRLNYLQIVILTRQQKIAISATQFLIISSLLSSPSLLLGLLLLLLAAFLRPLIFIFAFALLGHA